MALQMFRYIVERVAGTENVWGDLLSRRGCGDNEGLKNEKTKCYAVAVAVVENRFTATM